MHIAISAPGQFVTVTSEEPEVGRVYRLEESDSPTERQNRAFHALVQEYWKSGSHSYRARNLKEFRDQIKRGLGAGFESFIYAEVVDGKAYIREVKNYRDIPESVRHDPDLKQLVRGRLRSWSDYTKKERGETIDNLIAEMMQTGVKTKKFYEILDGMEEGSREAG